MCVPCVQVLTRLERLTLSKLASDHGLQHLRSVTQLRWGLQHAATAVPLSALVHISGAMLLFPCCHGNACRFNIKPLLLSLWRTCGVYQAALLPQIHDGQPLLRLSR